MPSTVQVVETFNDIHVEELSDPVYESLFTNDASDCLVAVISILSASSSDIETVTWDGEPLTFDIHKTNANKECLIAHIMNPNNGKKLPLVVGITGDVSTIKIAIITLNGVDPDSPVNTTAFYNEDVAEGHSLDITPTVDGCVIIDGFQSGPVTSIIEYEVLVYSDEDTAAAGAQYYEQTTAALKSMGWEWSGESETVHLLAAFQQPVDSVNLKPNMFLSM
jgi:hypothetical protein